MLCAVFEENVRTKYRVFQHFLKRIEKDFTFRDYKWHNHLLHERAEKVCDCLYFIRDASDDTRHSAHINIKKITV